MPPQHPEKAAVFTRNVERTHWHDKALYFVRQKRDLQAHALPEWEELRSIASAIKRHTLANLAEYLEQFERNATARGMRVHWARDGDEHNRIVLEILEKHAVKKVVKSKSMLTEECGLNEFLHEKGFEVIDTDLGERIVQLGKEPPSHIVMPAIHMKREDISALFHQHLNTQRGNHDPQYLTEAARQHLREKFLQADAGITGVNFGLADTGGFVVCTNEGNADLGVSLPKLHIASMGLEKLIPQSKDLQIFLRLLARSATGQPITTYSSHFWGPLEGGELHLILVDNGRSQLLGEEQFSGALSCIRCGACMNTCPVYRRSGGHSYGYVVPGPIGSILAPYRDMQQHGSLPFACSLCGSCTDVCPVKIDLHHQLLSLRSVARDRGQLPARKILAMKLASVLFRYPRLYAFAGWCARKLGRRMPRFALYNRFNDWGRQRELPELPAKSFRALYEERNGKQN